MKRKERLTRPEQYALVYDTGRTLADRFLVLKWMPNQLEYSRYGISINKRVGNAVVRNRIKRILREILRLSQLSPGSDFIFIVRGPAAASNYRQLENSITGLLSRARIVVERQ